MQMYQSLSQPAVVFRRDYQLLLKAKDAFLGFDKHSANCSGVVSTDNPLNVHEDCHQPGIHRGTISLRIGQPDPSWHQ